MEKRLANEKQLEALLEKDGHVTVFLFQNKIPMLVEIVKSDSSQKFGCFTNNIHRSHSSSIIDSADASSPMFLEFRTKFSYIIYFNKLEELFGLIYSEYGIIMPSNFNEKYNNFITSNKKTVFQVITKYCGTPNNDLCKYIFSLTDSPNYFVWALKLVTTQCVSSAVIKTIMTWIKNHQDLLKLLSRHTITAYTNASSVSSMGIEFMRLRAIKRANVTINEFNTTQKKLLKNALSKNILSKLQLKTLDEFSRLSDVKRKNFIRKVSTIEDIDEIFRLMELLVSTRFSWNADSVKEFIEVGGLNANVIYETKNVLVCEIMDYDTIKKMAKTTNWCIAKNKKYWSQYLCGDMKQYMVFNFLEQEDSDLSIVGFTTRLNIGIVNAHSFTNVNLMQGTENVRPRRYVYTPLIQKKTINNVYSFLEKCEIPLNLVVRYNTSIDIWDKNVIIEKFGKTFKRYEYDILENKDGRLVVKLSWEAFTSSNRLRNIVNVNRDYLNDISYPKYVLIFFDFNKDISSQEKLYLGVIEEDEREQIESCTTLITEFLPAKKSFRELLVEYKLPNTIIKRVDSVSSRLVEAICFGNYSLFLETLKEEGGIEELKKLINTNKHFREQVIMATYNCVQHFSLDFLTAIYDCGESISTIFGCDVLDDFVKTLYNIYSNNFSNTKIDLAAQLPLVLNGTIRTGHLAYHIVSYYMLKTAFEHEANKKQFIDILIEILYSNNENSYIANDITDLIIDDIDLSVWDATTHKLFTIICNHDCQNALKKVLNTKLKKGAISFIANRLHYDNPMLETAIRKKKEIVGS